MQQKAIRPGARGVPKSAEHRRRIGLANKKWSVEAETLLREHYATASTFDLAKQLGVSRPIVIQHAHSLGLHKTFRSRNPFPRRRWPVFVSAGDALTAETAYVLGLILADGNLFRNVLTIANTDRELLVAVSLVLGQNLVIHTKRKDSHTWYALTVGSNQVCDWVRSFGITERKSTTAVLPDELGTHASHVIRGYFDGDGTVAFSLRGGLQLRFVSGSLDLLTAVEACIALHTGVPRKVIRHDRGRPTANRLTYCGPAALRVSEWMYQDAGDLFLPRKRLVFENYRRHKEGHLNSSPSPEVVSP